MAQISPSGFASRFPIAREHRDGSVIEGGSANQEIRQHVRKLERGVKGVRCGASAQQVGDIFGPDEADEARCDRRAAEQQRRHAKCGVAVRRAEHGWQLACAASHVMYVGDGSHFELPDFSESSEGKTERIKCVVCSDVPSQARYTFLDIAYRLAFAEFGPVFERGERP